MSQVPPSEKESETQWGRGEEGGGWGEGEGWGERHSSWSFLFSNLEEKDHNFLFQGCLGARQG